MARVNYSYERRQRDLAKKKRKEEKLKRKAGGDRPPTEAADPVGDAAQTGDGVTPTPT